MENERIYKVFEALMSSDAPVLVLGKAGVGKTTTISQYFSNRIVFEVNLAEDPLSIQGLPSLKDNKALKIVDPFSLSLIEAYINGQLSEMQNINLENISLLNALYYCYLYEKNTLQNKIKEYVSNEELSLIEIIQRAVSDILQNTRFNYDVKNLNVDKEEFLGWYFNEFLKECAKRGIVLLVDDANPRTEIINAHLHNIENKFIGAINPKRIFGDIYIKPLIVANSEATHLGFSAPVVNRCLVFNMNENIYKSAFHIPKSQKKYIPNKSEKVEIINNLLIRTAIKNDISINTEEEVTVNEQQLQIILSHRYLRNLADFIVELIYRSENKEEFKENLQLYFNSIQTQVLDLFFKKLLEDVSYIYELKDTRTSSQKNIDIVAKDYENNIKEIDALIISLFAGNNVLLYGTAGTGKTVVCNSIRQYFDNSSFFRLTASLPDDITGIVPSKMNILNDDYKIVTREEFLKALETKEDALLVLDECNNYFDPSVENILLSLSLSKKVAGNKNKNLLIIATANDEEHSSINNKMSNALLSRYVTIEYQPKSYIPNFDETIKYIIENKIHQQTINILERLAEKHKFIKEKLEKLQPEQKVSLFSYNSLKNIFSQKEYIFILNEFKTQRSKYLSFFINHLKIHLENEQYYQITSDINSLTKHKFTSNRDITLFANVLSYLKFLEQHKKIQDILYIITKGTLGEEYVYLAEKYNRDFLNINFQNSNLKEETLLSSIKDQENVSFVVDKVNNFIFNKIPLSSDIVSDIVSALEDFYASIHFKQTLKAEDYYQVFNVYCFLEFCLRNNIQTNVRMSSMKKILADKILHLKRSLSNYGNTNNSLQKELIQKSHLPIMIFTLDKRFIDNNNSNNISPFSKEQYLTLLRLLETKDIENTASLLISVNRLHYVINENISDNIRENKEFIIKLLNMIHNMHPDTDTFIEYTYQVAKYIENHNSIVKNKIRTLDNYIQSYSKEMENVDLLTKIQLIQKEKDNDEFDDIASQLEKHFIYSEILNSKNTFKLGKDKFLVLKEYDFTDFVNNGKAKLLLEKEYNMKKILYCLSNCTYV
ncbi:MAG: AAA family ATPase [Endomicrobia bacterium]|nr:AAA family ATPase [Endomicrobiia bacterium]